jgi:hypothetical protein
MTICKECIQKVHFDHVESIKSGSNDQAAAINFLTQLKAHTSKALHLHSAAIKKINVEEIVKEQKEKIRESYKQLDLFLEQHTRTLFWKIRLCRYVEKLRSMYNEAKMKKTKLEDSRAEYMARAKKLLEASMKGKYDEVLIDLAVEKELDRQMKEMDNYKTLVEELKKYVGLVKGLEDIESKYTQETIKLKDIFKMSTGDAPSGKIVLVKENTSKLILYGMVTKKKEGEVKIDGYTAPMNYSSIEIKSLLYIIGGNRTNQRGFNNFLTDFVSISFNDATWRSLEPLKEGCRRAAVASVSERYIYVMGGDREADFLRTCERYDISTRKWASCPSLTEEKTNASANVFRGKTIYLFGGYNKISNELNTIEKFDTEKDVTWERIDLDTNSLAQNMGVIQISYNEMLLFGGMKSNALQTQTFIFKVEEKKLEKAGDMQKAESFSRTQPKSLTFTVLAIGSHFNDLHMFNLKTKKWTDRKSVV